MPIRNTLQMPGIAGERRLFKDGEFSPGGGQRIWGTKILGRDAIEFFTGWAPPLQAAVDLSGQYPDRPVRIFWRADGIFNMYVFKGGEPEMFTEFDPGPEERMEDFEEVADKAEAAVQDGTVTPGSVTVIISSSGNARMRIISA